jgi:hypothetical protein
MEGNDGILKTWASLPKDVQEALRKSVEESSAVPAEQFLAEMLTGECPQCGSRNTKDCAEMRGIEDFTVGICMNCGMLWCSECGRSLFQNVHCKHWEICDKCDEANEMRMCEVDPMECEKLNKELA